MAPFFSVIITTYNREKLLSRSINSLFKQDFSDWEAIIVDDGSNDNTFEFIKPIILEHLNVKYIYQKNQGLPAARNLGVSLSKGDYITFLDSDDEYKENHLSSRFRILQKNPYIDLLHGGVEIIGDAYVPDKNNPSKLIHLDECFIGGTFVIKRELFQKIGYFRQIDFADDTDFYERALKGHFIIVKTDIKTYIYHRDTPDSMCNILKNREL